MKHNLEKTYTPDYQLKRKSTDEECCILKFSMCNDKYPIYELNKDELKSFIKFAKKVENMKWREIRVDKGLNYEELHNYSRPDNISKDITIHSMRASKKFRVIGYKEDMFFYIIWFDNKHETC